MAGKLWNEEEIYYLRGHYGKISNKELSVKLGRSKAAIQRKAASLQLTNPCIYVNHPWTEKELYILQRQFKKKTYEQIAKQLKRSKLSVKKKAESLGLLVNEQEFLSLRTLASCFHCDCRVIYRWIRNDLPCHKAKRGKKTIYEFRPTQFWKWASTHKNMIPFYKYEQYSILPEPEWVISEIMKPRTNINHRKPITKREINIVVSLKNKGNSIDTISKILQRSEESVKHIYNKCKVEQEYSQSGSI